MAAEGDYLIVIGDKRGAVYTQGKWRSFECRHCVANLLKHRIGTNDSAAAKRAAFVSPTRVEFKCKAHPKHR